MHSAPDTPAPDKEIKCLVWDLDQTLWSGTLAEEDAVEALPESVELVRTLDERGILQSIASRNEPLPAWQRLQEMELDHWFLHPQIHWQSKSDSIRRIAQALNLGLDAIGFVDDQAFEREEVRFHLPEVRVYDATTIRQLALLPEFNPSVISSDTRHRRELYQLDQQRQQAEVEFQGNSEAFLHSLRMKLQLERATSNDLLRLEELTRRTHQLNTTGLTFSQSALNALINDPSHELWIVSLEDCFGSYGKVGVVLIRKTSSQWSIRLLLLSCRVMTRGIGAPLITWIQQRARQAEVELWADFLPTERNRTMYLTYKLAGFEESDGSGVPLKLHCDLSRNISIPDYLALQVIP